MVGVVPAPVFYDRHCLQLLVHGDNKKQTHFWLILLVILNSVKTKPYLFPAPKVCGSLQQPSFPMWLVSVSESAKGDKHRLNKAF